MKYRYTVTLEWSGVVEVDADEIEGFDADDVTDYVGDLAIDEALASPAGYSLIDLVVREENGEHGSN